jgi:hypothetical protein
MYRTKIQHAPSQFAWADDHYDSNLWYIGINGIIGQLSFSGDSALVSIAFEGPGNNQATIAHDGCDLWQGENFGSIYRIDDGIDEISWFNSEPAEGTIASEASAEIILQADLTALPEKDTSTILRINSNDPSNNTIFMPFNIAYSTIDLGTDTSFCGNLNILLDAGNDYKEYLWSDGSNEQTLLVDSTGYGLGSVALWVEVLDYSDGAFRDTLLITFEDCTGIEEFENKSNVSVIPNPVSESIILSYTLSKGASVKVVLYDAMGALVREVLDEHQASGKKQLNIKLSDMPGGVYYIRLLINEQKVVKKVVKL